MQEMYALADCVKYSCLCLRFQSGVQEMYAQIVYKDNKILELNNKILDHEKKMMDLQEFISEKNEVIKGRDKVFEVTQSLHKIVFVLCSFQDFFGLDFYMFV